MFKKIFLLIFLAASFAFEAQAQSQQIKVEFDSAGNKILIGKINESMLANDTAFRWFYQGVNHYQPNADWINYIRYYRDSFQVVAFVGTWCPDTKILLPEFYRVMVGAGYPLNTLNIYALDEQLHGLGDEVRMFHVTKTPTFIFLHNGKEIGRINDHIQRSMEADIVSILQNTFNKNQQSTTGNSGN